jgi:hypothetical protein
MSDWNRSGREDDQGQYRGEQAYGRERGGQIRGSNRSQDGGEQRSFDGDRYGGYSGGQDGRNRQGGFGGHGSQGYGREGVGGSGYGFEGQGYSGQEYRTQGYGYGGYRGQGNQQRFGERSEGQERFGRGSQGAGAFGDPNDQVRRVTDGDAEEGWFGMGGDRGRMGQHRGRGPKNYTRSDDRIREDVNDRLADDSWLDASEIDVQVKDGEVTLSGTVDNRQDKRRAEDIVENISGVKHVQNNIRVQQQNNQTGATTGPQFSRPPGSASQTTGSQSTTGSASGSTQGAGQGRTT